jgi:hypothetical protein
MTLRTTFVLVALAVLTIAPVASAGDTVLLRDGRGGSAEILETTPDSVTLQFLLEGNEVKIKLGAAQLDPHNFYTLRSKYMERTAENHLRLCAFCIENSLFAQARHEWDRAKELNPELSEEVARTPEVRQGIAKRMLENARKLFAAKELEEAEKAASSLVTHFPETPAAEQAQALLEEVNGSIQARETKTREEAEAKWKKSEEKDFESKKKSVAPIYQSWETAKKMRAQGLRTKGHSASKKRPRGGRSAVREGPRSRGQRPEVAGEGRRGDRPPRRDRAGDPRGRRRRLRRCRQRAGRAGLVQDCERARPPGPGDRSEQQSRPIVPAARRGRGRDGEPELALADPR